MKAVILLAAVAMAGLAGCMQETPEVTGRADFQALCAGCHGAEATGGGGAADLTRIAARNGGRYDHASVMSRIDGYTRHGADEVMPNFGVLLEGETVLVDLGDGVVTPTPARLFGISQYLASIQRDGGSP